MNLNNTNKLSIGEKDVNRYVRSLDVSPTLRINQICREKVLKGEKVYRLGLGQSPFPVPDTVVNALRLNAPRKDYLHVQGLFELRQAVSSFHRKKDGIFFNPENIIIGPGSKELLFLLQVVFDADTVVPSPSWVSYKPQAQILGKEIAIIDTKSSNNWCLMPDELDHFCRNHNSGKPLLLILNYPGNPTGTTYSADHLKALASVAAAHKVIILSDEIYGELHHEGRHVSIARFYPEGTIVSSGLSKWCGAGGWRLGTFSFPPHLHHLMKAMAIVASETYTSVSAPIQYAAITAFECDVFIEQYLWHVRRILKSLGNRIADEFASADIGVCKPTGAFYLFLDFESYREMLLDKDIRNAEELCTALLQKGIAVLPGTDFNRPADELTVRLSYVDFDGARALAASYQLGLNDPLPAGFLEQYAPNVLNACGELIYFMENSIVKNEI